MMNSFAVTCMDPELNGIQISSLIYWYIVQEKRISIAKALELRFSFINPSI